ncbi:MAG: DUF481 domain-containing protein [Chlorobi bacterium]|nr:DUF481 domain-containing protein [Chlorobiota bacterium]
MKLEQITALLVFIIISFSTVFAQDKDSTAVEPDTLRRNALKIFLDCASCDEDYIRQQLEYINYVRDRREAQIHIMVTSQSTGSGGREYTFHFLGQKEFKGMNDTLVYVGEIDDTREMVRNGQLKTLKLGLARYVARTPLAEYLNIEYNPPEKEKEVVEDKWKSWVFDLRVSGFLNGQKSRSSYYYSGSMIARKVTPEWKYYFKGRYNITEDKISTGADVIYSSLNSKSFSGLVVKSISDHWSAGGRIRASQSSFSNYKFRYSVYPGLEYDIFPYSESTRKQLRILYTVGFSFNNYQDSTIYEKTEEYLIGHSLDISFEMTQKWGSVETSLNWSNYFFDWSKNNLSFDTYLNIRVAKGLRFNVGGYLSLIHDQLNLVKGGATTEEILLYRKELETNYSFFTSFGITYTFGSIYNNVVNPRFGSGGGGRTFYY